MTGRQRKQDWTPRGQSWEQWIDGILRELEKSGSSEALAIAQVMRGAQEDGALSPEMAMGIALEFADLAEALAKRLRIARETGTR